MRFRSFLRSRGVRLGPHILFVSKWGEVSAQLLCEFLQICLGVIV